MKQLLLIFTSVLLWKQCYTQSVNIVPNSSFEDTLNCPNGLGQLYNALSWYNPTNTTPDYYNKCTDQNFISVPGNFLGFQHAKTGNAYAGIVAYTIPFVNPNAREYIEILLDSNLINGQTYCIKLFLSLANSCKYSISNIGIYLSNSLITSSTINTLNYNPQIKNPAFNYLKDTSNWMLVSGYYKALGGERYMVIGNFDDDNNTLVDTTYSSNVNYETYYYIDDVSVILCDTTPLNNSNIIIPNIFTPNNDGINDVFKITTTKITSLNCKIYNRWGILVGELTKINEVWDGLTTSGLQCESGVYYYIVTARGEDGKEYDEKGFVQLVR